MAVVTGGNTAWESETAKGLAVHVLGVNILRVSARRGLKMYGTLQ